MIGFLGHLLHPLNGEGYQFWSGIGSGSPVFVILAVWWRKHNCHVTGCWRLQWHADPEHGHPVCRKHHVDGGDL